MPHWILWIHDWAGVTSNDVRHHLFVMAGWRERQGHWNHWWIQQMWGFRFPSQRAFGLFHFTPQNKTTGKTAPAGGSLQEAFYWMFRSTAFSTLILHMCFGHGILHRLTSSCVNHLTWSYMILHYLTYVKTSLNMLIFHIHMFLFASYISLHLSGFAFSGDISFNQHIAGEPSLWRLGWLFEPGIHHGEGEKFQQMMQSQLNPWVIGQKVGPGPILEALILVTVKLSPVRMAQIFDPYGRNHL